MERADSVRLLQNSQQLRQNVIAAANAALKAETHVNDANDDEVQELTGGTDKPFISASNSKPGLLPGAEITARNAKLNLGLPQQGTFADSHDGQKASPSADPAASVSTQHDLQSAHALHKSIGGNDGASFDSISTEKTRFQPSLIDRENARSTGSEQS